MLKKLLCVATLLTASSIAFAAPVTYTVGSVSTNSGNYTINATKFDDAGGTLQLDAVIVSFSTSLTTQFNISNNISTPFNNTTVFVNGSAALDFAGQSVTAAPSITQSLGILPGDTTINTPAFTDTDTAGPNTYITPAILAYFQGSGTADFTFNPTAISGSNASGNATIQYITTANADVTVEYVSSLISTGPVPVSAPAHLALLGLGLLAFSGFRKTRK